MSIDQIKVFIRGLTLSAEVGVITHEYGRKQPLVIDIELELAPGTYEHIGDTVNYATVAQQATALAESGHFNLVETFAERLARLCLEDAKVVRARVRVEKPQALAPAAAAGGVEVSVSRTL